MNQDELVLQLQTYREIQQEQQSKTEFQPLLKLKALFAIPTHSTFLSSPKNYLQLFVKQNKFFHILFFQPPRYSIHITESLKGFQMKPLWIFSYSQRDNNFRVFHMSKTIDGLNLKKPFWFSHIVRETRSLWVFPTSKPSMI